MKSVKGRKPRRKHLYIGYGLITFGTVGLVFTIQTVHTAITPQNKLSVLSAYLEPGGGGPEPASSDDPSQYFTPGSGGTSTSSFNEPILMHSSIGYSTRTTTTTNTETNNSYTSPASNTTTTSKPKTTTSSRPTPTPTKKVTSAKTTPTPTPTISSDATSTQEIIDIIDEQFNQPTDTPTENTNPSPTGPFPTQHQARTGNTEQSSNNIPDNTSPKSRISFYGNTTPTDSTLLPSDSLSSTQQEFNTILKDQGIHVTIQNVDKQTVITATNSEGRVIHFTSDLVNKLTDLLLQDAWPKIVKINESNFEIKKGTVVAQTHFPVGFDPVNDTPMISLGTEDKHITILPDQAAAHILQTGLMDTIGPSSFFRYIFPRYTPPPATTTMQLAALNDEPIYTISGSVKKKIFNVIPVPIQRTIFISAANGVTVQMNENPFFSLLDKISQ